jgi:L-lactate dehydrogenase complex protein LldG
VARRGVIAAVSIRHGQHDFTAGRPNLTGSESGSPSVVDPTPAFEAQAGRVGATVHRALAADLPALVVRILGDTACRTVAVADAVPDRAALLDALAEARLALVSTSELWPTRRADAGVSVAKLGVAETGSALLHSSSEDRRVEVCVDVHLVLLERSTLVPTLDAAFRALRDIAARPPAYASLVSGPSRSADIERQLTIGVHGPRELHILLWEASR